MRNKRWLMFLLMSAIMLFTWTLTIKLLYMLILRTKMITRHLNWLYTESEKISQFSQVLPVAENTGYNTGTQSTLKSQSPSGWKINHYTLVTQTVYARCDETRWMQGENPQKIDDHFQRSHDNAKRLSFSPTIQLATYGPVPETFFDYFCIYKSYNCIGTKIAVY